MDRGQNRRDDVFRGRDPFAGFGSHRSLISGFFGGRDRFDDPFFTRPFGGQMMGEHGMFGPGPFGGQMMGEHDMFGPSPFGPMGGPFGDMGNHGFIEQAPPRGNSRRPVITEVDEDEGENAEHGNKQPNQDSYVQEPDDGSDGTEGGQVQLRRDLNSANSGGQPQARTFTYQSSSVTYGGINGAYYTASTTRRTGSDGITVEESKEADTTTKEATHRISRGIHDKGHSLTRKLNSDGKVDTTQTMHNLNEDELAGFEESWKGNAGHYLPGWNQNAGAPNSDNSGREKGKSKSVSFYLSDASGVATPTDTNSEMGNIGNSCSDKLTDENLSNSSQQMTEKHSVTEDQYSNDQDHEGEPLDHTVEQQPNSDVGEIASSMKLRCRKKLQKVGTPNHTVDDCFDEDCVEPSLAEEDNDSGDDYTTGNKRKARKKSRDGVEESQQQKVQKNKSKVSSRGRKRTLKDELAAKPEKKKLTHRIRQRTPKEIKTLLESEEIDPMKLSAAHLRLLQEARERVNPKEIPSGPSSNSRFCTVNGSATEKVHFPTGRTQRTAPSAYLSPHRGPHRKLWPAAARVTSANQLAGRACGRAQALPPHGQPPAHHQVGEPAALRFACLSPDPPQPEMASYYGDENSGRRRSSQHHPSAWGSGDLASSAKLVVEAARLAVQDHSLEKVDKGRVTGATADLLHAAS